MFQRPNHFQPFLKIHKSFCQHANAQVFIRSFLKRESENYMNKFYFDF